MIDFMVDCEPRMTDLVFESTWSQGIEYQRTVPLKCETEGGQGIETCVVVLWNLSGSVNGQGSNV